VPWERSFYHEAAQGLIYHDSLRSSALSGEQRFDCREKASLWRFWFRWSACRTVGRHQVNILGQHPVDTLVCVWGRLMQLVPMMFADIQSNRGTPGSACLAIDSDIFPSICNFSYALPQHISLAAEQVIDVIPLKIWPVYLDDFFVKASINEVVVAHTLPACFVDAGLIFKAIRYRYQMAVRAWRVCFSLAAR
jgi:hypothetical protein